MVRRLEQGGEPLDFISIIEVEAESTKMNPVSTFQKVDLLLIIKKIFERYGLIKPPYLIWINDLREQLLTLNTIEDIKYKIIEFDRYKFKNKETQIQSLLQLFDLQVTNALMSGKSHR